MGKLDGKIAIVTGASRGIGMAIAEVFASEGATVVCAARKLQESTPSAWDGSLERTVGHIKVKGGRAVAVQTDVTKYEDCKHLIDETVRQFGRVDILVNNAGVYVRRMVADYTPEQLLNEEGVNINGTVWLCQLAAKAMIPHKSGAIVNISSPLAAGPGRGPYNNAGIGFTVYGATKGFVERFTQGFAQEVFQHGISVTALSTGLTVYTPGYEAAHRAYRQPNAPQQGGEPAENMGQAALQLATLPQDKYSGRVVYSIAFLHELGLLPEAKGYGADRPSSGYSKI